MLSSNQLLWFTISFDNHMHCFVGFIYVLLCSFLQKQDYYFLEIFWRQLASVYLCVLQKLYWSIWPSLIVCLLSICVHPSNWHLHFCSSFGRKKGMKPQLWLPLKSSLKGYLWRNCLLLFGNKNAVASCTVFQIAKPFLTFKIWYDPQ